MSDELSLGIEDMSSDVGKERGDITRESDVQSVMTWECAAMIRACEGQWATRNDYYTVLGFGANAR